jgi:hypothetical protein
MSIFIKRKCQLVKHVGVVWIPYQNICLDVGKGKLCTVQEGLILAVDPVVLTDILFQTPGSQCLLLFGKPGSGTGEIGQDEDSNHSNDDGDSTFNDEEPAPGKVRRSAHKEPGY